MRHQIVREKAKPFLQSVKKRHWIPYAVVAPAIILILLIKGIPLLSSFVTGLFSWRLTQPYPPVFIGLENYRQMLSSGPFWEALGRTAIYAGAGVSLQFIIGFIVALALVRLNRGRKLIGGLVMMPMMVPSVVAGLTWMLLYEPQYGVINYLLKIIGLPGANWLASPSTALLSIIIVETWRNTPFVTLILSAGLTMLPTEPYEAAEVDGASPFQTFRHLTLPMMLPLIHLVLVMRLMDALRAFDTIYVLTKGGPGRVTETSSIHVYKSAFEYFQLGYGSVLAQALFLIVMAVSLAILLSSKRQQA